MQKIRLKSQKFDEPLQLHIGLQLFDESKKSFQLSENSFKVLMTPVTNRASESQ